MRLEHLVLVIAVACTGGEGSGPAVDAHGDGRDGATVDASAPDGRVADDADVRDGAAPDAPGAPPDAAVVARAWTAARAAHGLTGAQAEASNGMAIVRGADGVITAAWRRQVPGVGYVELWCGRFTPATGWSMPVVLADGYDGRAPLLVASASGAIVLVWQAQLAVDGARVLRSARYTPAAGWSPMEELQGVDASFSSDPSVAIDDAGEAVVAWTQGAANIANVWARRQGTDGTWQAPVLLEHDDAHVDPAHAPPTIYHHAYAPQVAVDNDGGATVAWWQGYEGNIQVWAARSTAASGWSARAAVPGGEGGHGVSLVADRDGVVHALWTSNLPSTQRALRTSRFTGGGWTPATALATSAASPTDAALAADHTGVITAVWSLDDGAAYDVRASRYTPGAGWTAAEVIADAGVYAPGPALGVDATGAVQVVWVHQTADRGDVYARRYVPGSGWQSAELVEVDDTVSASEPDLAVAPDGSAVVMWMMTDAVPEQTTRRTLWVGRYQ